MRKGSNSIPPEIVNRSCGIAERIKPIDRLPTTLTPLPRGEIAL
jgi:hypothetical protein